MAVLLSTTDGKALTGTQHRALNQALGITDDYVIDNYGGKLASTYTGWQITTQTGMAVLNGTLIEITSNAVNTFDAAGVSGTAMVIAKVNLSTKIATIELKKGTTLVQNNLLSSLTGTREVELYRFTYSPSAITGFTDKRIIRSNGIDTRVDNIKTDLQPIKDAGGFLALVDVSVFYCSTNTVLTASHPQIIPLTKDSGGLAISSNIITLQKGFIYEGYINFRATDGAGIASLQGINAAGAKILKTDQTIVTATYATAGQSQSLGGGIIDLISAVNDEFLRIANLYKDGSLTISGGIGPGYMSIKKYKKIPFDNI